MIRPPRHLGIVGNRGKEGVRALVPPLVRWARAQGRKVSLDRELTRGMRGVGAGITLEALVKRADAILVLGGDGTMLGAARAASAAGVPILGVNLGGLGFLTETAQEDLYPALERLFRGDVTLERRTMVEAQVRRRGSKGVWQGVGLNDAVIHPSERSRVIAMDLRIAGKEIGTLVGDGLIVASPTGSTAYSLSAGGPIVRPSVEALLATPISPHTVTWRPLLVGADETIRVRLRPGHPRANLTMDGQVARTVTPDDEILIRRARRRATLIVLEPESFYDVLRTKLAWATSPRGRVPDQ
ncbi:MAG TPA: NAD(+)/NADH kinase [Candidatus Omnitrophota bacterium]|jgi:NAD+ kinase|nr:NAD(+)/NADH kinase [Candidatus Omnitrophota bacterium]